MMSPELKQAVEERVALGHTKEQIAAELEAAGYDHESIEQIYAAVSTDDSVGQVPVAATEYVSDTPSPGGSLIGYGALVKHGFALAASQWKVFVLTFVYQIGAIILCALSFGVMAGILGMVPGGQIISIFAGLALFILYFIVAILIIGAMLRAILLRAEGASFSSHIAWMRKRALSGSSVAILQQLVIFNALYVLSALFIIVALIVFPSADGLNFSSLAGSGGALIAVMIVGFVLGYIGHLVAATVLTAYTGWAMLTFVSGRATGMASLTESAMLVTGRLMSVFWRLLFFGLLAFVFMLVVSMVLAIFGLSADASEAASSLAQLLFIPFLVSASVLLYESLRSTEQPTNEVVRQKIHSRVKVGVWTGVVAVVVMILAIAGLIFASLTMFGVLGGFGNTNDFEADPPSLFQTEQTELDAEMQAELEAFQQQFQAEFDAN